MYPPNGPVHFCVRVQDWRGISSGRQREPESAPDAQVTFQRWSPSLRKRISTHPLVFVKSLINKDLFLHPHRLLGQCLTQQAILPAVAQHFDASVLAKLSTTISCVLGNLLNAFEIEQKYSRVYECECVQYVAYSRRKEYYVVKKASEQKGKLDGLKRYKRIHFTCRKVCSVVDRLIDEGLIEHQIGFDNPQTGYGRCSRMRASDKLKAVFLDATAYSDENIDRYFHFREKRALHENQWVCGDAFSEGWGPSLKCNLRIWSAFWLALSA